VKGHIVRGIRAGIASPSYVKYSTYVKHLYTKLWIKDSGNDG
jgi:hypothetical protein